MSNPFKSEYKNSESDQEDIRAALTGSVEALERLVKRHQNYVYNVAHKMVMNPMDAEDVTQEVLVKMVTKLAQFEGRSDFRTWLYRITFNHFLRMKSSALEDHITTFEAYGDDLEKIKDVELTADEQIERSEEIEEAKLGCLAGMLLCLSREQRAVYVLGDIFEADHGVGAEMLDISKANFRKRLERARSDHGNFMHSKCGLINKANPCRCARKTTGFVKAGWVDPDNLRFNAHYVRSIKEQLEAKTEEIADLIDNRYAELFKDSPFQEKEHADRLMSAVLMDEDVRRVFNLN